MQNRDYLILYCIFICISGCFEDNKSINDKPLKDPVTTTITPEEIPWYKQYSNIILASDPDKHIYQLKLLQQIGGECTMHPERNLFFTHAMFSNNKKDFLANYQRMISSEEYEKFATKVSCQTHPTHGRMYPDMEGFFKNSDWTLVLPPKSDSYAREILRYAGDIIINTNMEQFSNITNPTIRTYIKNILLPIEKKELNDNEYEDIAIASSQWNLSWSASLFEALKLLNKDDDFSISLDLSTRIVSSLGHAIALLIYKKNKVINYVILDSYNVNFLNNNYYKSLVYHLYRLSSNNDYARKTFIRKTFIRATVANSFPAGADNMITPINQLRTYLADNLADEFFNRFYKKEFCRLTRSAADALLEEENKLLKAEILSGFSCD